MSIGKKKYLFVLFGFLFVVIGIVLSVFLSDYLRLVAVSKKTNQGIDYLSKSGVRHRLVVFVGLDENREIFSVRDGYENGDYETVLSMKMWVPRMIGGRSLLVPLVLKRDNGTYILINNKILGDEKFNEMYPGIKSTYETVPIGSLMDLTTMTEPESYFRATLGVEFDESVLYRTMTDLIKQSTRELTIPLGIPTLVDDAYGLPVYMKLWLK